MWTRYILNVPRATQMVERVGDRGKYFILAVGNLMTWIYNMGCTSYKWKLQFIMRLKTVKMQYGIWHEFDRN